MGKNIININNEQEKLEELILLYQIDSTNKDKQEIYNKICQIYPPQNYIHSWYKKYRYLYSNTEDFYAEYIYTFCKALISWKPRNLRGPSKYNGKGEFKNYFISCLNNKFYNMIKAQSFGKRSIASKCPICEEWFQSLSIHLLKQHEHLLWEQLLIYGQTISDLSKCPFCKSLKIPKTLESTQQITKYIKKHILSRHSNFLFERFNTLYADCYINNNKTTSIYISEENDEDGNELSLYDVCSKYKPIDALFSCDLSFIQKQIIEDVLNGKSNVHYDKETYKCSKQIFITELEALKEKMMFCGFEI